MCVQAPTWHSTGVEARREFMGVCSLLLVLGFELQLSGFLAINHLYELNHHTGPSSSLLKQECHRISKSQETKERKK